MKTKFEDSVNKAAILLNIPTNYDDFILFKIIPVNIGCCCMRCMPETWNHIKRYINKGGSVDNVYNPNIDKNEGEFLIESDNIKVVLECHESGPEFVINGLSISLTAISIIVTLTSMFISRRDKQISHIKFKSVKRIDGNETQKEIELDAATINDEVLKDFIEKAFKEIKR